jgi:hypothetical protein
MQFGNINIKYSIFNVQTERLTVGNSWISQYTIYDHTKEEAVSFLILDNNFFKLGGNQGIIFKDINSFFEKSKISAAPETNILFHEVIVSNTILTDEILETLCTNQGYLVFINELRFVRSIMIEKCIVQLFDLKNKQTLNDAFLDTTINFSLELEHATNVKNFESYFENFLKHLQTY